MNIYSKKSITPIVVLTGVIGVTTLARCRIENIINKNNNTQSIPALPNNSIPNKQEESKPQKSEESKPQKSEESKPQKPNEPEQEESKPKLEKSKFIPKKLQPANLPTTTSSNINWANLDWNDTIKPKTTATYESFKEYLRTITNNDFQDLMSKINNFANKKNIKNNNDLIIQYYKTNQNDFNKIVYTISYIKNCNKFESIEEILDILG